MHLLTIDEVSLVDKNGVVIWRATDLKNTLHAEGEELILKSLFARAEEIELPETYYVGLDNRDTISKGDTLENLVGEPTGNGYTRYSLNTTTGLVATFEEVKWKVKARTLIFNAIGGGWGPVENAFLTTGSGAQGYLISTIKLPEPKIVNSGESYSFRLSFGIGG